MYIISQRIMIYFFCCIYILSYSLHFTPPPMTRPPHVSYHFVLYIAQCVPLLKQLSLYCTIWPLIATHSCMLFHDDEKKTALHTCAIVFVTLNNENASGNGQRQHERQQQPYSFSNNNYNGIQSNGPLLWSYIQPYTNTKA